MLRSRLLGEGVRISFRRRGADGGLGPSIRDAGGGHVPSDTPNFPKVDAVSRGCNGFVCADKGGPCVLVSGGQMLLLAPVSLH